MKILFFPRYPPKGPSSRYRIYQYLPYFKAYYTETHPFFDEKYGPDKKYNTIKGILYLIKLYTRRTILLLKNRKRGLIFLQYDFLPFVPFNTVFFKLFRVNYIVDYDDAIFHQYDQHANALVRMMLKNKINKVMKHARFVITGSAYLTAYAQKFNKNVVEIPTSVDLEKYENSLTEKTSKEEKLIIGWIGSRTTSVNVLKLIPVFNNLSKSIPLEIRLIGFNEALQHHFKNLPVKFIAWRSETEVQELRKCTVGIMPLEDTLFNKGKCAFKIIQYMACGLPAIATPLEANINVDRNKENRFAITDQDWETQFLDVYNNRTYYEDVGKRNIEVVKKFYSIQSNYTVYLELFGKMNTLLN